MLCAKCKARHYQNKTTNSHADRAAAATNKKLNAKRTAELLAAGRIGERVTILTNLAKYNEVWVLKPL